MMLNVDCNFTRDEFYSPLKKLRPNGAIQIYYYYYYLLLLMMIVLADTVCQVRHIHNQSRRRHQVTLSDNSKQRSMGRTAIALRSVLTCCLNIKQ